MTSSTIYVCKHSSTFAKISTTKNRILPCRFPLYFCNPGTWVPQKLQLCTGWAQFTNCCLQIDLFFPGSWFCTNMESEFWLVSWRHCCIMKTRDFGTKLAFVSQRISQGGLIGYLRPSSFMKLKRWRSLRQKRRNPPNVLQPHFA